MSSTGQKAQAVTSTSRSGTETVVAQSSFSFDTAGPVEIVLWVWCEPKNYVRSSWKFTITVKDAVPVWRVCAAVLNPW